MVLPGFRFVDEDDVSTAVPDYSFSLLAACYKLMKSHPLRFCHSGSLKPEEYVWGIHHEDWMRAHAVIVFTITRQLTIEGIVQSCRDTSAALKFGSPYHMSLDSEIYGYVASEELAAGGHLLRDPAHDAIDTQLMSRRATNEEIAYVLRDIVTWRSKSDFERLSILQDPWGALVEVVTDAVCVTLDLITPSIDWQLDMDGPRVSSNSAPMNSKQLLHLKTWLKEQMQQQHCDKGVSAEFGDILPLSTADPGLDRSREMDAWLGYSPRFNEESLFDICERRGSGVYDIATEKELQAPHISGTRPSASAATLKTRRLCLPRRGDNVALTYPSQSNIGGRRKSSGTTAGRAPAMRHAVQPVRYRENTCDAVGNQVFDRRKLLSLGSWTFQAKCHHYALGKLWHGRKGTGSTMA
jgi:hypothetical protein